MIHEGKGCVVMVSKISQYTGKCAMVVEDVPSMRQLLVRLLQEIGFSCVISSEDGADALKRMESATQPIDIVISDIEMPIINGLEFIQMMRKNTDSMISKTPVIVVTGHSEERNLFDAVHAGVHGFIVKPVSRKTLEGRLRYAFKNPSIKMEVLTKKAETNTDTHTINAVNANLATAQSSPETVKTIKS